MTAKNIITLPNRHLRERSRRVGVVTPEILKIAENMQNATLDWEDNRQHELGVALAACQIDQLLRIVVVRNDFNNKTDRSFQVLINPKIVKREGGISEDYEGCLSIKNIYGKVPRYEKVKLKAIGIDGHELRLTAEGFLARVLQHETDHTNGKLFIDHIKNNSEAFYMLDKDGKLKALDYAKDVKNNKVLWG